MWLKPSSRGQPKDAELYEMEEHFRIQHIFIQLNSMKSTLKDAENLACVFQIKGTSKVFVVDQF